MLRSAERATFCFKNDNTLHLTCLVTVSYSTLSAAMNTFVILVLATLGTVCQGCRLGPDWKSQTIEERATKPDWVVYGNVVSNHLPPPDGNIQDIDQEYVVVVKPLCWLKESPEHRMEDMKEGDEGRDGNYTDSEEFDNIRVLEYAPCTYNNLTRDKNYILFLSKRENAGEGHFALSDVNTQIGAFEEPSIDTVKAIHRGIDRGSKYPPRGRCVKGVEIACFLEKPPPGDCNMGTTIKVTLWAFFIGTAFAIGLGMTG